VITIILIEDHQMVREGIKRLLAPESNLRIIGEASDGRTALELIERRKPNVLLLDLTIPSLHGLEVIRALNRPCQTKIIVLSMHADEPYVIEALKAGASGYVIKDSSPNELVEAINSVMKGNLFISPALKGFALDAAVRTNSGRRSPDGDYLTAREKQVLQFAAEGNTSVMIASRMFLSPRTVESHRSSLMKKLGLKTQTDLVRYAIRKQILSA
jgi:DNA-binding NarL/FixJ family response regulator